MAIWDTDALGVPGRGQEPIMVVLLKKSAYSTNFNFKIISAAVGGDNIKKRLNRDSF